ncbi:MAG: ATP-binding protein, partial [Bdellovibrionota bacterium]
KLQIQQERLIYSEKMSALGTMAAGVAHEINTPLATISMAEGNMKSMLEDLNFDRVSFEKSLNVIEKTVQRIVKVTTALRAYAKDGAGGTYEPVSLGRVVDESLIFCESAMKDAGIKISIVHHSGAEIDFDCRVQQVTQVLLNLLQNAMDAVETASSKEIKIETKSDEDIIEIKVSDSGAGMADEVKNKIFDPFFTTKQVGKGMGLGLSLAKGIIDLHQGTICYERISGRSNFIIRVPKQRTK